MAAFETPLTDKSLYATVMASSTQASVSHSASSPSLSGIKFAPPKASSAQQAADPGPTDLLIGTPVPILHLIARLSPFINLFTSIVRLLTWTHPSSLAPWLLLFAWWTVCLGGVYIVRYALNPIGLLVLAAGWLRRTGKHNSTVPSGLVARSPDKMDTSRLLKAVDDSRDLDSAVEQFLISIEPVTAVLLWRNPDRSRECVGYLLTSYPAVLCITHFVPLHIIFLVSGSLVLLYNAPWFAVLRRALWHSLVVRFFCRIVFGILVGGRGLTREFKRGRAGFRLFRGRSKSQSKVSTLGPQKEGQGADVHFLFTIFENQRWWIGLDWTQALLPNERPSW